MKATKKPVTVECFELQQSYKNWPEWAIEALSSNTIVTVNMGKMTTGPEFYADIKTLEGTHRASPGDYIIQGVKGEIYPCKPDIFKMTYDICPEPATQSLPTLEGAHLPGLGFR